MADITCNKCGYVTSDSINTWKDDKGQLVCPQCREPYEEKIESKERKFRFK